MRVKPFEHNIRNKIVPMAQSILIRHGEHVPTLFVYDKNGIEKITELSELFSVPDKDAIFNCLRDFLKEIDAKAYVLINEVWYKKAKKDESFDDVLDGNSSVADCLDKSEALMIHWEYNSDERKEGVIKCPYKQEDGYVSILYDEVDDMILDGKNMSGRGINLLSK
jgi:hypothetical protein|tara:strand:+ start:211 stop:708 length:498 start_codon:yes stop_codon:yes gene_type:complete